MNITDSVLFTVVPLLGDAVCLLRALLNCGDSQRHDVMRNYSDRRGQSLLEEIVSSAVKHHWRSWVVFTAELLLLTKPESTVKYVKRLLSDDHLSEVTLARVLCCQSDEDVQALLHSYSEITGESLVDEINDKCTAESAEALSAFLSEKVGSFYHIVIVKYVRQLLFTF